MNLNRILLITLVVLMFSSYETSSSILFTLLMKLLMIKGALFMSMPLSIGAFVMGQGMGFFAGNMMGGYMMLRAANRYHNKEKTKWVSHSGWHGPPYHTNNYQKGYNTGKTIVDAINAGKAKVNAIASIFKPFRPAAPKRPPRPVYGPPPSHGTGWGSPGGYPDYHASYSDPTPAHAHSSPYPYPADAYGGPPPSPPSAPGQDNMFKLSDQQVNFQEYYPGGNRKNGFSSLLSSIAAASGEDFGNQKIKRIYNTEPPSPSGFYTSAYTTPGQEFTGILTNDPTSQGDKYLRGEPDTMGLPAAATTQATTTNSPNEILESYLEQRLKEEAEKQKDSDRKQEAQQLVQLLRKAYLKQLVDSLKEEEVSGKGTASNRQLDSSSPFASLSASIESLFGSRESRSAEEKSDNEVGVNSAKQNSQNLIRELLINEVFTSGEKSTSPRTPSEGGGDEKIGTAEVESITERIMSLTSSEREELVKGLDTFDAEEEAVNKPEILGTTERIMDLLESSSTENAVGDSNEGEKKREERSEPEFETLAPAQWVLTDNTFSGERSPFAIRVRRQVPIVPLAGENGQQGSSTLGGVAASAEEQKQIQSFVNDIRKFFTLLSALDQDTCLQKLVCDVHTNEKDVSTLTQYESNILTTFKLMKALMPEGEEDSSTKYRYAAVVGETGQSMELCQQTYPACGYSTSQIVALGTQQEATPTDWANVQGQVATTVRTETVTAAQKKEEQPQVVEKMPQAQSQSQRREDASQSSPSMIRRRYQQQQSQYSQHEQYSPPQRHRPDQEPEQEPTSYNNFFNYGEFFRSMWSDSMMGRSRRSRQYFYREN